MDKVQALTKLELQYIEEELMLDPSISIWLKQQITFLKKRDPLDAMNDLEILLSLTNARLMTLKKPI